MIEGSTGALTPYRGPWMIRAETELWLPAIPLPFLGIPFKRCNYCKRKFWTMDGYRAHFALHHILERTR